MTKHTPGPWVIGEPHPTNACAYVCDNEGHEVATLYHCSEGGMMRQDGIWPEQPNRDANARLIHAAPDMLGALEMAYTYLIARLGPAHPVICQVGAAITKATGG